MDDWQVRYKSMLDENNGLTKKLADAQKIISILEAEKNQWTMQKDLQSQIIAQQLGNSDNTATQLQNEIISLKRRLKKYEDVD